MLIFWLRSRSAGLIGVDDRGHATVCFDERLVVFAQVPTDLTGGFACGLVLSGSWKVSCAAKTVSVFTRRYCIKGRQTRLLYRSNGKRSLHFKVGTLRP
jgi:hypothetical protein